MFFFEKLLDISFSDYIEDIVSFFLKNQFNRI